MKINGHSVKVNPSKIMTAISERVDPLVKAQRSSNNSEHFNEFYPNNNTRKKVQGTEKINVLPGEIGYNLDIKV